MTPERVKEIACAFSLYHYGSYPHQSVEATYDRWKATEEGKRLTAEPLIICPACEGERQNHNCACCKGEGVIPDRRRRVGNDPELETKNKSEESCIILLQKVVAQLDRMEGNMKLTKYDETLWDEQEERKRTRKE